MELKKKNVLHVNNKGIDQPTYQHNLISGHLSAFVVGSLEGILVLDTCSTIVFFIYYSKKFCNTYFGCLPWHIKNENKTDKISQIFILLSISNFIF